LRRVSTRQRGIRTSAAERIERTYGLRPSPLCTLAELSSLEARLSACSRIERNFGLRFDYRTATLAQLTPAPLRIGASGTETFVGHPRAIARNVVATEIASI
jgi:hypothetical protein